MIIGNIYLIIKNEEGKISTNADMEDIVPEPKVEMVEIEAEIMEVQDIKKPEIDEVVEEIIDEPVEEFAAEIVLDEVNELEDEIFEIVDDTGILDCVENDVVDIIDQIAEETEKYEEIVAVEDVEETIDDVKGKKIGVQINTTGDTQVTEEFGDDAVDRFQNGALAVESLKNGKIDCVVIDGEVAESYFRCAPYFSIIIDGIEII